MPAKDVRHGRDDRLEDCRGEEVGRSGPEGFDGGAVEGVGDGGEDRHEDGGVEGDHLDEFSLRDVNQV